MNWTEPKPPTKGVSYYDHITCETPIGTFMIEWKSWKYSDLPSVMLDEEYIGCGVDVESAKNIAHNYIVNKYEELRKFLENE